MTVKLSVRRDARTTTPPPTHRLDWDTDPDLGRFDEMTEHDKVRVIIRVLCGLVALEEATAPPAVDLTRPEPATPRRRLLPFLGYERPIETPLTGVTPARTPVDA
jgi:hypothetical protein